MQPIKSLKQHDRKKGKQGKRLLKIFDNRKNIFFLGTALGAFLIACLALVLMFLFLRPQEVAMNFSDDKPKQIELSLKFDKDTDKISGNLTGEDIALYHSDSSVIEVVDSIFNTEINADILQISLRTKELIYHFEFTPEIIKAADENSACIATSSNPVVSHTNQFVASKSSKLYHPTENCSFATRIKEENRVYFASKAEAEATGRTPSSCFD